MPTKKKGKKGKPESAPPAEKADGTQGVYVAKGLFDAIAAAINPASTAFNAPAQQRANEPLFTNPYVYGAAAIVSSCLSRAPFTVLSEQDDAAKARKDQARKKFPNWVPASGRRRDWSRYLRTELRSVGATWKSVEPLPEHPLAVTLRKPNQFQSGTDLIEATVMMMLGYHHGQAFWVALKESGELWAVGDSDFPFELRLIDPSKCQPIYQGFPQMLVGWEYSVPSNDPFGWGSLVVRFPLESILHFKLPHPTNPAGGMGPTLPSSLEILADVVAQMANVASMSNGCEPGLIISPSDPNARVDPVRAEEVVRRLTARHQGPNRRRLPAVLDGMFKVDVVPEDMTAERHGGVRDRARDSVLSSMRVPLSQLSSDAANYATQLGQDRNLWIKTILPLALKIEEVVNTTLLWNEPDNIVAGFFTQGIEALVEQLNEKVETAIKLITSARMPPVVAFKAARFECERYIGDDRVLVSPLQVPIEDVLDPPEVEPDDEPAPAPTPAPDDDPEDKSKRRALPAPKVRRRDPAELARLWRTIIRFQEVHYESMSGMYRGHTDALRRETLDNFDAVAGDGKSLEPVTEQVRAALRTIRQHESTLAGVQPWHASAVSCMVQYRSAMAVLMDVSRDDLDRILFDIAKANERITEKSSPRFHAMLDGISEVTAAELGGLAVFTIDDPRALSFMQNKSVLIQHVNKTIRARVRATVLDGIERSLTVNEIRTNIIRTFNVLSKQARALTIARTETAQMFSGVRDIIFQQEGVSSHSWVSAQDEEVRDDHVALGEVGAVPIGTNFMDKLGKPGVLLYPSYVGGPADQIINCRCVAVAEG